MKDQPACHNCRHFRHVGPLRSGNWRPILKSKMRAGICGRDGEAVLMGSWCGEYEVKEEKTS